MLTITFASALLVGLVGSLGSAPAAAADSSAPRFSAATVSSTTGQQGHKLKWLPYRPSKSQLDGPGGTTGRVARTASTTSTTRTQTAQRTLPKAFEDPFQDAEAKSSSAAAGEAVTDEVMEKPQPEPVLGDWQVELPDEQPDLAADMQAGQLQGDSLSLDQAYAEGGVAVAAKCPSPDDEKFHTPISELTTDISATDGDFPPECPLTDKTFDKTLRPSTWAPTTFTWKASGVCHKPLYFEDVQLERYGHSWGPYIQPIISGGHFFLTVPALPYLMGLEPPCECVYTLGYYRPGSCAPYLLDPLPLSVRAALAEGSVWTGLVYLIP